MSFHGIPIAYDDREDWLAKRRAGVGASDVAAIVGLSPWGSPFSVWAEKTAQQEKPQTESMSWGSKLEGVVLDEFEDQTGLYVRDRQLLVQHPQIGWALATVDGCVYESAYREPDRWQCPIHGVELVNAGGNAEGYLCVAKGHDKPMTREEAFPSGMPKPHDDMDDVLGVVEAKTDHSYAEWKEIPDHYQIQVAWQMFVTGVEHAWIAVLHGGRNFHVYEVEADQGIQLMLRDKVADFWGKHINGRVMPEVDDHHATTRVIGDLWMGDGDEVEVDGTVAAAVEALAGWKVEANRVQREVDKLENQVKAALGDAAVGVYQGAPLVSWKRQDRKGYYVEPKSFRVMRLLKRKETE